MSPSPITSDTPTFHSFRKLPSKLKVQIIPYAWEAELENRDTGDTVTLEFVTVATKCDIQLIRSSCPHLLHANQLFRTEILRFAADRFILPFNGAAKIFTNRLVFFNPNTHVLELDLQGTNTSSPVDVVWVNY
jgi:hypothetical protein